MLGEITVGFSTFRCTCAVKKTEARTSQRLQWRWSWCFVEFFATVWLLETFSLLGLVDSSSISSSLMLTMTNSSTTPVSDIGNVNTIVVNRSLNTNFTHASNLGKIESSMRLQSPVINYTSLTTNVEYLNSSSVTRGVLTITPSKTLTKTEASSSAVTYRIESDLTLRVGTPSSNYNIDLSTTIVNSDAILSVPIFNSSVMQSTVESTKTTYFASSVSNYSSISKAVLYSSLEKAQYDNFSMNIQSSATTLLLSSEVISLAPSSHLFAKAASIISTGNATLVDMNRTLSTSVVSHLSSKRPTDLSSKNQMYSSDSKSDTLLTLNLMSTSSVHTEISSTVSSSIGPSPLSTLILPSQLSLTVSVVYDFRSRSDWSKYLTFTFFEPTLSSWRSFKYATSVLVGNITSLSQIRNKLRLSSSTFTQTTSLLRSTEVSLLINTVTASVNSSWSRFSVFPSSLGHSLTESANFATSLSQTFLLSSSDMVTNTKSLKIVDFTLKFSVRRVSTSMQSVGTRVALSTENSASSSDTRFPIFTSVGSPIPLVSLISRFPSSVTSVRPLVSSDLFATGITSRTFKLSFAPTLSDISTSSYLLTNLLSSDHSQPTMFASSNVSSLQQSPLAIMSVSLVGSSSPSPDHIAFISPSIPLRTVKVYSSKTVSTGGTISLASNLQSSLMSPFPTFVASTLSRYAASVPKLDSVKSTNFPVLSPSSSILISPNEQGHVSSMSTKLMNATSKLIPSPFGLVGSSSFSPDHIAFISPSISLKTVQVYNEAVSTGGTIPLASTLKSSLISSSSTFVAPMPYRSAASVSKLDSVKSSNFPVLSSSPSILIPLSEQKYVSLMTTKLVNTTLKLTANTKSSFAQPSSVRYVSTIQEAEHNLLNLSTLANATSSIFTLSSLLTSVNRTSIIQPVLTSKKTLFTSLSPLVSTFEKVPISSGSPSETAKLLPSSSSILSYIQSVISQIASVFTPSRYSVLPIETIKASSIVLGSASTPKSLVSRKYQSTTTTALPLSSRSATENIEHQPSSLMFISLPNFTVKSTLPSTTTTAYTMSDQSLKTHLPIIDLSSRVSSQQYRKISLLTVAGSYKITSPSKLTSDMSIHFLTPDFFSTLLSGVKSTSKLSSMLMDSSSSYFMSSRYQHQMSLVSESKKISTRYPKISATATVNLLSMTKTSLIDLAPSSYSVNDSFVSSFLKSISKGNIYASISGTMNTLQTYMQTSYVSSNISVFCAKTVLNSLTVSLKPGSMTSLSLESSRSTADTESVTKVPMSHLVSQVHPTGSSSLFVSHLAAKSPSFQSLQVSASISTNLQLSMEIQTVTSVALLAAPLSSVSKLLQSFMPDSTPKLFTTNISIALSRKLFQSSLFYSSLDSPTRKSSLQERTKQPFLATSTSLSERDVYNYSAISMLPKPFGSYSSEFPLLTSTIGPQENLTASSTLFTLDSYKSQISLATANSILPQSSSMYHRSISSFFTITSQNVITNSSAVSTASKYKENTLSSPAIKISKDSNRPYSVPTITMRNFSKDISVPFTPISTQFMAFSTSSAIEHLESSNLLARAPSPVSPSVLNTSSVLPLFSSFHKAVVRTTVNSMQIERSHPFSLIASSSSHVNVSSASQKTFLYTVSLASYGEVTTSSKVSKAHFSEFVQKSQSVVSSQILKPSLSLFLGRNHAHTTASPNTSTFLEKAGSTQMLTSSTSASIMQGSFSNRLASSLRASAVLSQLTASSYTLAKNATSSSFEILLPLFSMSVTSISLHYVALDLLTTYSNTLLSGSVSSILSFLPTTVAPSVISLSLPLLQGSHHITSSLVSFITSHYENVSLSVIPTYISTSVKGSEIMYSKAVVQQTSALSESSPSLMSTYTAETSRVAVKQSSALLESWLHVTSRPLSVPFGSYNTKSVSATPSFTSVYTKKTTSVSFKTTVEQSVVSAHRSSALQNLQTISSYQISFITSLSTTSSTTQSRPASSLLGSGDISNLVPVSDTDTSISIPLSSKFVLDLTTSSKMFQAKISTIVTSSFVRLETSSAVLSPGMVSAPVTTNSSIFLDSPSTFMPSHSVTSFLMDHTRSLQTTMTNSVDPLERSSTLSTYMLYIESESEVSSTTSKELTSPNVTFISLSIRSSTDTIPTLEPTSSEIRYLLNGSASLTATEISIEQTSPSSFFEREVKSYLLIFSPSFPLPTSSFVSAAVMTPVVAISDSRKSDFKSSLLGSEATVANSSILDVTPRLTLSKVTTLQNSRIARSSFIDFQHSSSLEFKLSTSLITFSDSASVMSLETLSLSRDLTFSETSALLSSPLDFKSSSSLEIKISSSKKSVTGVLSDQSVTLSYVSINAITVQKNKTVSSLPVDVQLSSSMDTQMSATTTHIQTVIPVESASSVLNILKSSSVSLSLIDLQLSSSLYLKMSRTTGDIQTAILAKSTSSVISIQQSSPISSSLIDVQPSSTLYLKMSTITGAMPIEATTSMLSIQQSSSVSSSLVEFQPSSTMYMKMSTTTVGIQSTMPIEATTSVLSIQQSSPISSSLIEFQPSSTLYLKMSTITGAMPNEATTSVLRIQQSSPVSSSLIDVQPSSTLYMKMSTTTVGIQSTMPIEATISVLSIQQSSPVSSSLIEFQPSSTLYLKMSTITSAMPIEASTSMLSIQQSSPVSSSLIDVQPSSTLYLKMSTTTIGIQSTMPIEATTSVLSIQQSSPISSSLIDVQPSSTLYMKMSTTVGIQSSMPVDATISVLRIQQSSPVSSSLIDVQPSSTLYMKMSTTTVGIQSTMPIEAATSVLSIQQSSSVSSSLVDVQLSPSLFLKMSSTASDILTHVPVDHATSVLNVQQSSSVFSSLVDVQVSSSLYLKMSGTAGDIQTAISIKSATSVLNIQHSSSLSLFPKYVQPSISLLLETSTTTGHTLTAIPVESVTSFLIIQQSSQLSSSLIDVQLSSSLYLKASETIGDIQTTIPVGSAISLLSIQRSIPVSSSREDVQLSSSLEVTFSGTVSYTEPVISAHSSASMITSQQKSKVSSYFTDVQPLSLNIRRSIAASDVQTVIPIESLTNIVRTPAPLSAAGVKIFSTEVSMEEMSTDIQTSTLYGSFTSSYSSFISSPLSSAPPTLPVAKVPDDSKVQMRLRVPTSQNTTDPSFKSDLETKLTELYTRAQTRNRRKRDIAPIVDMFVLLLRSKRAINGYQVKIISIERDAKSPENVNVEFYVEYNGKPVKSSTSAGEFNKLSYSEMDATLGFTVLIKPSPVPLPTSPPPSKLDTITIVVAVAVPFSVILVVVIVLLYRRFRLRKRITKHTDPTWKKGDSTEVKMIPVRKLSTASTASYPLQIDKLKSYRIESGDHTEITNNSQPHDSQAYQDQEDEEHNHPKQKRKKIKKEYVQEDVELDSIAGTFENITRQRNDQQAAFSKEQVIRTNVIFPKSSSSTLPVLIAGPQSGDEKERSVLPETDILSGVPPSEPKHEHVDFMKEVREERKKEEDVMEEQRKKLEEEKKEQERIIEEQKKLEEEKRALLEKQILNLQAELELIKREKARDEQRRLISESGVPKNFIMRMRSVEEPRSPSVLSVQEEELETLKIRADIEKWRNKERIRRKMERYQRRGKATNVRELIKIDGLPTVDEEKENRRKKARWRKAQDEIEAVLSEDASPRREKRRRNRLRKKKVEPIPEVNDSLDSEVPSSRTNTPREAWEGNVQDQLSKHHNEQNASLERVPENHIPKTAGKEQLHGHPKPFLPSHYSPYVRHTYPNNPYFSSMAPPHRPPGKFQPVATSSAYRPPHLIDPFSPYYDYREDTNVYIPHYIPHENSNLPTDTLFTPKEAYIQPPPQISYPPLPNFHPAFRSQLSSTGISNRAEHHGGPYDQFNRQPNNYDNRPKEENNNIYTPIILPNGRGRRKSHSGSPDDATLRREPKPTNSSMTRSGSSNMEKPKAEVSPTRLSHEEIEAMEKNQMEVRKKISQVLEKAYTQAKLDNEDDPSLKYPRENQKEGHNVRLVSVAESDV